MTKQMFSYPPPIFTPRCPYSYRVAHIHTLSPLIILQTYNIEQ